MKVYPFFIPHYGCEERCVFCQQHRISGVLHVPTPAQVAEALDGMLPPHGEGEVAFYGGSFTLLEASLQEDYLACIQPFIRAGRVTGIRVSTRPDGCGADRIARLQQGGVTTVELGCQSFCDEVLLLAKRGHEAAEPARSVTLLRHAGFRVGLQLMPGLPGGSADEARRSLATALALEPDFLRIYPAVVLAGTALEDLWRQGEYVPLSLDDAVELCSELLWYCHDRAVPVIRLGLQASTELDGGSVVMAGPYHPAFGQLVRSRLWRRAMELAALETDARRVLVAFADLSDALGHRRSNGDYLQRRFGGFEIVAAKDVVRHGFRLAGQTYDMLSKARYLQPLPMPYFSV